MLEGDFQLKTYFSLTSANSNITYSLYGFMWDVACFIYPCATLSDLWDKRAKEKKI